MTDAAPADLTRITDESLRAFAGYTMKRAFNVIRADVTRALQPFGLRMVTFSALAIIGENSGLRQSQLADALAIERPNLVALVDELESAGLITRERLPQDRRVYVLAPTRKGRKVLQQATDAVRSHDARMTAGLSAKDRERLVGMLKAIERAGEAP